MESVIEGFKTERKLTVHLSFRNQRDLESMRGNVRKSLAQRYPSELPIEFVETPVENEQAPITIRLVGSMLFTHPSGQHHRLEFSSSDAVVLREALKQYEIAAFSETLAFVTRESVLVKSQKEIAKAIAEMVFGTIEEIVFSQPSVP